MFNDVENAHTTLLANERIRLQKSNYRIQEAQRMIKSGACRGP